MQKLSREEKLEKVPKLIFSLTTTRCLLLSKTDIKAIKGKYMFINSNSNGANKNFYQ